MFLGRAAAIVAAGRLLEAGAASASHDVDRGGHALTPTQTRTLVAWCEHLVPGAGDVGEFVNAQLAKAPADALLSVRYFGWPPPWDSFYRDGVAALDGAASSAYRRPFSRLDAAQREDLHQRLLGGSIAWSAPAPFFLFYLVTRSDAVDVVYGTPKGYARLGFPYHPQVAPVSPW